MVVGRITSAIAVLQLQACCLRAALLTSAVGADAVLCVGLHVPDVAPLVWEHEAYCRANLFSSGGPQPA